jgi:hypothetical protein
VARHDVKVTNSLLSRYIIIGLYIVVVVLLYILFSDVISSIAFIALAIMTLAISFKLWPKKNVGIVTFGVTDQGAVELPALLANGELLLKNQTSSYQITNASFYNGFFMVVKMKTKQGGKSSSLVIFKDSVTESDYRLLARVIKQL